MGHRRLHCGTPTYAPLFATVYHILIISFTTQSKFLHGKSNNYWLLLRNIYHIDFQLVIDNLLNCNFRMISAFIAGLFIINKIEVAHSCYIFFSDSDITMQQNTCVCIIVRFLIRCALSTVIFSTVRRLNYLTFVLKWRWLAVIV